MSDRYLGQIGIFSFNFAPRGFAMCNGQLMPINQNQALFALLGTMYGGNGQTTFALPNLQGRTPIGQGQGPGLTNRFVGESAGEAGHTLSQTEMPAHNHFAHFATDTTQASPAGHYWAPDTAGNITFATSDGAPLSAAAIGNTGGNQPHDNRQPYSVLNYCIALQHPFPSRN